MGVQDRDYMHERRREADRAQPPRSGVRTPFTLERKTADLLRPALVFGIVILLGFLLTRYLLEYRHSVPFPETGHAHWFLDDSRPRVASLRLRAPTSARGDFVVLLDDWATGAPVVSIPVRSGESSITLVPLGRYRVTIASGSRWQGPQRLFGASGTQRIGTHPLEFYRRDSQLIGHTIDLEVPFAGNMETTSVRFR